MTAADRYSTKGNPEDIYYPNTEILINKANIEDEAVLLEVEKGLLENSTRFFIGQLSSIHSFDSKLLIKIHKKYLGSLYSWAGKYRTVDISKGNTRFAAPQYIEKSISKFDTAICKENYLHNLDTKKFIERLAYFKCELLAIHPFREGNGRTIRLFCDLLAIKEGYAFFEYPTTTAFIKKYIDASIAGVIKGNPEPMKKILEACFRK